MIWVILVGLGCLVVGYALGVRHDNRVVKGQIRTALSLGYKFGKARTHIGWWRTVQERNFARLEGMVDLAKDKAINDVAMARDEAIREGLLTEVLELEPPQQAGES